MATVGHALVGFSLAGVSRARSRDGRLPHAWAGLMVLMAHLVDIAEWVLILVAPAYFDQHYVTNSPLVTAGMVAAVWIALTLARVRRPWPYLLVAAAVFSHLLLDQRLVRTMLTDAYDGAAESQRHPLYDSVVAEIWLYGLLLVLAWLIRTTREPGCPRSGRTASWVLGILATLAAATRRPWLWGPVYLLAAVHSLLLSRRDLTPRLLWSVIPVTPILALLLLELWAGHLYSQAIRLFQQGDNAGAASVLEATLSLPTRSRNATALVNLGECRHRLREFAAAETAFRQAIKLYDRPGGPQFLLARLYSCPEVRNTPYHRPDEAVRLLRQILNEPNPAYLKNAARQKLEELRRGGLAAPPGGG